MSGKKIRLVATILGLMAIVTTTTAMIVMRINDSPRDSETGRFRIVIVEAGREVEMTAGTIDGGLGHRPTVVLFDVDRDGQHYDRVAVLSGRVYITRIKP